MTGAAKAAVESPDPEEDSGGDTDEIAGIAHAGEETRMTLVEHLEELRSRLVKSLLAFGVAALAGWFAYPWVLALMIGPYRRAIGDPEKSLVVIGVLEGFSIRLKVVGFTGLILALPVILWQIWRFISPGLRRKEKRYAVAFVASSIFLFVVGICIAYVTAVPALGFLLNIGGSDLTPLITADKYIGFFIAMSLAFGLSMEFPLVLMFLVLVGALDSRRLLRAWRIVILIVTVFAAVITPSQDPISLLAMALPMLGFYFIVIAIARWVLKK